MRRASSTKKPIIASAIMGILAYIATSYFLKTSLGQVKALIALIAIVLVAYVTSLFMIDRKYMKDILRLALQRNRT